MSAPTWTRCVDKKTAEYLADQLDRFNDESLPIEQRIAAGVEAHRIIFGEDPDGPRGN